MNTLQTSYMDGGRIDRATQLLRAYNHRFRFQIVNCLLNEGPATAATLASCLHLDEAYVDQHLEVLRQHGLVTADHTDVHVYFHANESRLRLIKSALHTFSKSSKFKV